MSLSLTYSPNPTMPYAGITFSGTQTITLKGTDYIIHHDIPGSEGGIVERVGRQFNRIRMDGWFNSGDVSKDTMMLVLGSGVTQLLLIPSPIQGNFFYNDNILIESFKIWQLTGFGYPLYKWTLEGVAIPWQRIILGVINVNQQLPIFVGLSTDTSQTMPISVGMTIDYNQTLPTLITVHMDNSQTLPISAGMGSNFVRMSGF